MPVVSPQGYVDPGAQKRDTVGVGIAEVFQGIVRGMQMGQQLAAQQQQMEIQRQVADRQELDFARNLALEDASVAATLDPLEPLNLGGVLGTAATQRKSRGVTSAAPPQERPPFDRNAAAAELDDAAFQKSEAQRQAAASRNERSLAEDELMAAEFADDAMLAGRASSAGVNQRNAQIQQHILQQSRGEPTEASVVPGAEGPQRVPSPGHRPSVSSPDRLTAAMESLGGLGGVGPSRQDLARGAEEGDQYGRAIMDERDAKRRADADTARAASMESGLPNPALELGAGEDVILDPTAVARAVMLYKRTGDPKIFDAFGGQIPEDLDGLVERVTAFARAVNKKQIAAYTAKYLGAGKAEGQAADPLKQKAMGYAAQFMGVDTDDWQQAKLWGERVAQMIEDGTPAHLAVADVTREARAQRDAGRRLAEEEARRKTAAEPRTSHSYSHVDKSRAATAASAERRKTLEALVRAGSGLTGAAAKEFKAAYDVYVVSASSESRRRAISVLEKFAPAEAQQLEGIGGLRDLAGMDKAADFTDGAGDQASGDASLGSIGNPYEPATPADLADVPVGKHYVDPRDGSVRTKL
jgi:hypothetical protein